MYVAELEDGTRVQAYKHRWTRGYLHLDRGGRAFVQTAADRYEEAEADQLAAAVLARDTNSMVYYSFVRHNDLASIELGWTRSATKHRISRERSGYVVRGCGLRFRGRVFDGSKPWMDDRVAFLGDDHEGVPLEVLGVEVADESFLVIHASKLRIRFSGLYERAKEWQR